MKNRAFRRHCEQKKKKWAARTFKNHSLRELDEIVIGIRAHTPAICSCYICGNPRKLYGNGAEAHKISERKRIYTE